MQIAYFPYLNLSRIEEISFGDIKIWNFDRKAREYIPDEALRTKVKALLDSNVKNNQPLQGIGVLSIGPTDFRVMSFEEHQTANEIRLILFLTFLAEVNVNRRDLNAGHFFATSEVDFLQIFETKMETKP